VILFVSLMSLLNPHYLRCQNSVNPDSVLLVKNSDGTISYLFPKRIAIEYLNLRKELVPQALSMIDSLSLVVLKQDTLTNSLTDQNTILRGIVYNDSLAIARLMETVNNTEQTLKNQKRKIRLWKFGAVSTGIIGTILGFLIGQVAS